MDTIKLVLWCPAERVPVGVLEGDLGARVTREYLEERFRVSPEFSSGFSRAAVTGTWRDGFPCTCPRCGNVCGWAPVGPDSLAVALSDLFDPPVGSFTLAGASPRKGANPRPGSRPGVDPALRASPLISDDLGGRSGPDGTLTEPSAGGNKVER